MSGMSDLTEQHIPPLLSLVGRYEDETLTPLVLLMSEHKDKFASDSAFGKLLVAVVQNVNEWTSLKNVLLEVATSHKTVLGKKAVNLLKKIG